MEPIIFPEYRDPALWGKANLNEEFVADFGHPDPSPALLPSFMDEWLPKVAKRHHCRFTYGGHDEPRPDLWRGHYHDPAVMRHRGTDYNVPAGTQVAVPAPCRVIRVVRDPDQNGGWGGLVFFQLSRWPYQKTRHFLYGHLAHDGLPGVGDSFVAGQVIGAVGHPGENGGWYAHLHVQCFIVPLFEQYYPRLEKMDGYGPNHVSCVAEYPDTSNLMAGHY